MLHAIDGTQRWLCRSAAVLAVLGLFSSREAHAWEPVGQVQRHDLSGTALGFAQDHRGYMWVGTGAGLHRLVGRTLESWITPEGTKPRTVARLVSTASDGALWAATGYGFLEYAAGTIRLDFRDGAPGLVRIDGGAAKQWGGDGKFATDWATALVSDGAGGMWVGSEAGLSHVTKDGALKTFANPMPTRSVTALVRHITQTGEDGLWVGTTEGVVRFDGKHFDPPVARDPALAVAVDGKSRLWIASPERLVRIDRRARAEVPLTAAPTALLSDRRGRIWLGGRNGLFEIQDGTTPRLGQKVFDGWVVSLFEDREGSIWIGTRGSGFAQLRPVAVTNFGSDEGVAGTGFSVLLARDGAVWSIHAGGVSYHREGKAHAFRFGEAIPSYNIRYMTEGSDGALWFSGGDAGLVKFQNGTFSRIPEVEGVKIPEFGAIYADVDGALWVAWKSGGVSKFVSQPPSAPERSFTEADGLCIGPILQITPRARGGLWLAGMGGLAILENARARCGVGKGQPIGPVRAMVEDKSGRLWLSTGETGELMIARGETLEPVEHPQIPSGITGIAEDDGTFWLASSRGVYAFEHAALTAWVDRRSNTPPVPVRYDGNNGMSAQECVGFFHPSIAIDTQHRLWVPTLAGLSVLEPPKRLARAQADAHIAAVSVGGRSEPTDRPLTTPRGGAPVIVTVSTVSYLEPDGIQFRHRLGGDDSAWTSTPADRVIRLMALPPGQYTLQVEAIDARGPLGKGANIAIIVPGQWLADWRNILLVCLLVFVSAAGLYRIRINAIERRHRELRDERLRIARELHDGLTQGLAAVGLHLDSVIMQVGDADPSTRANLETARTMIDTCQNQARQGVWSLRGEARTIVPLRTALERAASASDLPPGPTVQMKILDDLPAVGPGVMHEVERIVHEALVNARKHGGGTKIEIKAQRDDDGVIYIFIDDDGVGIDANGPAKSGLTGAGLVGMHERAYRFGGKLTLGTGPGGRGTRVTLSMDLDRIRQFTENDPS